MARDVSELHAALMDADPEAPLAAWLLTHPEHRRALRRVQIAARNPYSEIRDNLLAADMVPLDMLRCKLSFFGATKFDPKSDRWLRINMYQGAPFPDEFDDMEADDWAFPPIDER